MTGVLIKRENLESGMHMGQHVNMKEEAWVMNVQAKQHQKLLADTTCRCLCLAPRKCSLGPYCLSEG